MTKPETIKALLALLDDPDEKIGRAAMAELLKHPDILPAVLTAMQDDTDGILRRRSHQLQAALTVRQRRRQFINLLTGPALDVADGLIELHLQWYDNDARDLLQNIYQDFAAQAETFGCDSLTRLADYLRQSRLKVSAESSLQPERYCLGPILESGDGAGSILALLTLALGQRFGLHLQIVRALGEFILTDDDANILSPKNQWQVTPQAKLEGFKVFTPQQLLHFGALMLFSGAVNSDSFRYIHTVAQALTGAQDSDPLTFLPYPYGDKE